MTHSQPHSKYNPFRKSGIWPVDDQQLKELTQFGITFPGLDGGQRIGSGAFGEVWLADIRLTDGSVVQLACKKLSLELYAQKGISAKFSQQLMINEMNTHEMVKHPHVIDVKHVYRVLNRESLPNYPITVLIFMELCDGDLSQLLSTRNVVPMNERIASHWFLHIVMALHYLHSIGVAHRDIKSDNILYKREPTQRTYIFKLTDFGLVKILDEQNVNITPLSPESVRKTEDYKPRKRLGKTEITRNDISFSDVVYSLGVCLLQCLKRRYGPYRDMFGNGVEIRETESEGKFSEDVKQLLSDMITFNVQNRFTISDVYAHRWTTQYRYQPYYDMEFD